MTPQQVVAVLVRLFAVWLAVQLPGYVVPLYHQLEPNSGTGKALIVCGVVALVWVGAMGFLWVFPKTVARLVLSQPAEGSATVAPPREWMEAGYVLIGVFVLTQAVPRVLQYMLATFYTEGGPVPASMVHWLIAHLVELGLGLWLVLGPASVGRLINRARYAGSKAGP
jgi:hypothetical protein